LKSKKEFNVKKDVSKDDLNLIDDCIRKIKLNWKKAKEITNIDSQNPKISEKVFEYDAENEKTGGLIKLFICSDTKDIWIQGWEKKKTKKNNLIKYKLLIKCILPIEIQDCVEDLITTVLSGFKDFKKKVVILETQAEFPQMISGNKKKEENKPNSAKEAPLEAQTDMNLKNFVSNNQLKYAMIKCTSKITFVVKEEEIPETEYFGHIRFCWQNNSEGTWKQKLMIKAGDILEFGSGKETYKGTFICVSKARKSEKPNLFFVLVESKSSPSKANTFEIKKTSYSSLTQIFVGRVDEKILSRNNDLFVEYMTSEIRNDITKRTSFVKSEIMYFPVESLDKANQNEIEEFKSNIKEEIRKISDVGRE